VDADGAVAEGQEFNNQVARSIVIGPDLVIAVLSAPSSAAAGATVAVSDTTRNQGGGAAGASVTRFYLSANGALDTGDPVLGARAVPALGGGASDAGATSVTIPPGTAPGTYYLFGRADADGAVAETSDANNIGLTLIQVTP
jgi:subtilase family serine protease